MPLEKICPTLHMKYYDPVWNVCTYRSIYKIQMQLIIAKFEYDIKILHGYTVDIFVFYMK